MFLEDTGTDRPIGARPPNDERAPRGKSAKRADNWAPLLFFLALRRMILRRKRAASSRSQFVSIGRYFSLPRRSVFFPPRACRFFVQRERREAEERRAASETCVSFDRIACTDLRASGERTCIACALCSPLRINVRRSFLRNCLSFLLPWIDTPIITWIIRSRCRRQ